LHFPLVIFYEVLVFLLEVFQGLAQILIKFVAVLSVDDPVIIVSVSDFLGVCDLEIGKKWMRVGLLRVFLVSRLGILLRPI
jgi:hypothetical protein